VVAGLFANLALNLGWTWIFFQAHAPIAAGIEIACLLARIAVHAWLLRRESHAAAIALLPYGAWVAFAGALT
jgi:tryptophan-rich sensory protein